MQIISPTNEYTVIARHKDGRRYSAFDLQDREVVIVIEEDIDEAKRLVPVLMEWEKIAEFSDFYEYFPYNDGIAAVFAFRAGGERLDRVLEGMPYGKRAEAMRGVFALSLRQCLPREMLCGVMSLENLFIFPSGRVEMLYDLPRCDGAAHKNTLSALCGECNVPNMDKLHLLIQDIEAFSHVKLFEEAANIAHKLAQFTGKGEQEAPKAEGIPDDTKERSAPEGYVEVGSRYISRAFLLLVQLAALALIVLYVTTLHPLIMQKWYEIQSMPVIKLGSKYLEEYLGDVRLVLKDGTVLYEGAMEAANANGRGKLYENGELIYDGEFVNNQGFGYGKLYVDGALVYAGEFVDGVCSGAGRMFNADGSLLYDGAFVAGVYEGYGKLYQEGYLLYEGDFIAGLYEGSGKLYKKDALIYEGEFRAGLSEGKGKRYQDDAVIYEGDFVAGLYEGKGKRFEDGELVYDGDFSGGLYHGAGKLYEKGELKYEGGFASGLYEGEGKLYRKGALLYEGEFLGGEYNGAGLEYSTITGHLVFSGRYLLGKRMDAGTHFDEDGHPIVVIKGPEPRPEPLSLLGESYESAIELLLRAQVSTKEQAAGDELLLIDEEISTIYVFKLMEDGKPDSLSRIYYYGLTSVDGVVTGADVSDIEGGVDGKESLGAAELLVLGYSNMKWGRDAQSSKLRSMEFSGGEDRMVTAFYLPPDPPVFDIPKEETEDTAQADDAAAEDKTQASKAEEKTEEKTEDKAKEAQSAEPEAPSGRILFLRVIYSLKEK